MMTIKEMSRALEKHPLITAAGLCQTPSELGGEAGSDVDMFVYCSKIPREEERRALMSHIAEDYVTGMRPTRWGICDLMHIQGEEVWLMYVTERETLAEARAILAGDMPERHDNYYYPVGRLATFKNLLVLFDKTGFIEGLKRSVSVYPESLARLLTRVHAQALSDTEDLERSAERGDALYYHFALDLALDHFLQALFALNREYFPSRKRSLKYVAKFEIKPECCEEMLVEILRLGGSSESTGASYAMMKELIAWTSKKATDI